MLAGASCLFLGIAHSRLVAELAVDFRFCLVEKLRRFLHPEIPERGRHLSERLCDVCEGMRTGKSQHFKVRSLREAVRIHCLSLEPAKDKPVHNYDTGRPNPGAEKDRDCDPSGRGKVIAGLDRDAIPSPRINGVRQSVAPQP
jgi:hypothetical protein